MMGRLATLFCLMLTVTVSAQSRLATKLDMTTMRFEGQPAEQAAYLLRTVFIQGKLRPDSITLPTTLSQIFTGQTILPSTLKIRKYFAKEHLVEAELGGKLKEPLSVNATGISAGYFVIHDTSTPLYPQSFPPDLDQTNWKYNKFNLNSKTSAHVFVNRAGASHTYNSFQVASRATKLESTVFGISSRGIFIHIELIQPRRTDPAYKQVDATAPEPGFTTAQLKRLALLYIIASVRGKAWLIPAYHAVLDEGLADGHDDPQHFDLQEWDKQIGFVLNEISVSPMR